MRPADGALEGADGLAIVPSGRSSATRTSTTCGSRMKTPVIFDGRNLYSHSQMQAGGVHVLFGWPRWFAGENRIGLDRIVRHRNA